MNYWPECAKCGEKMVKPGLGEEYKCPECGGMELYESSPPDREDERH